MLFAESDHKLEKLEKVAVFVQITPVEPGDLVILTIPVIVSVLGIAELISGEEHRCSPAAHEHRAGIADHAVTENQHFLIIGFSLHTTVPASVVVAAVRVVPAIALIVLRIIRIQIVQSKSVVAGQKVHAGVVAGIISFIVREKSAVHIAGTDNSPESVVGQPGVTL